MPDRQTDLGEEDNCVDDRFCNISDDGDENDDEDNDDNDDDYDDDKEEAASAAASKNSNKCKLNNNDDEGDTAAGLQVDQYYEELFPATTKNPNGCPITISLYVSDEFTQYDRVSQ